MLSGKFFSGALPGSPGPEYAARVVLAGWATILLVSAALPAGSFGRTLTVTGASWAAEAFAAVSLTLAFLRSSGAAGRLFWALFGGAVIVRYIGDLVWTGSGLFGMYLLPVQQATTHALSYPLFFGVLLWLVKRGRREMTPVAALDTVSAMLSSGVLLWFFVLDSAAGFADPKGWEAFVPLVQAACDLGLFLLALGALLTVRSPFAAYLTGGLLVLLLADGAYLLELRTSGTYVVGGWPVLLWTGGVALLGIAALHRGSVELPAQEKPRGSNLETLLFWLGPLSPPLQYGALLVWGTFYPPLPGYVLLHGAALLGIFAVRTYAIARVEGLLADKRETLARELAQCRILGELHDTVKQSVRGTSMMIEACAEAQKKGDPGSARELLGRALEMSREAGHQISKPLEELRLFYQNGADAPTAFFKERFEKFGADFDFEIHEDLQVPLEVLGRAEIAVAHRVGIEALWNTARHARARNLRLESYMTGSVFVLEVRDDGRGFHPEEATEGLGLRFMRSRAEEVGADLDVISARGKGTTVRLRFATK